MNSFLIWEADKGEREEKSVLNLKLKKVIAGTLAAGAMLLPCIGASAAGTTISVGSGIYVNGIVNIVDGGSTPLLRIKFPNPISYKGYLSGSYSHAITGYVSVGVGSGNYTSIWSKKIINASRPSCSGSGSTSKNVINIKIQYNNTIKTTKSSC